MPERGEDCPEKEARARPDKRTDPQYKQAIGDLEPTPSNRKRQKIERELRNRVRVQLGLSPYEPTADPLRRAIELGISPGYDLPRPNGQRRRRHLDQKAGTMTSRLMLLSWNC